MSRPRLARALLALLSTATLGACDESTGSDGSVQITLGSAALTVTQGTTSSSTVTITRQGGFAGVVTLAASGVPTGVFATLTPSQLSASANTAVVELASALFSVPGTYTVTIAASGEGIVPAQTSLQLTVMPAPDFSVTTPSRTLVVTAGTSITSNVNIQRTNFVGAIELEVLGAPVGMTTTFNPAATTSNSSSMTITVAPGVTPASYPLVVQGLALGIGSRTATLVLDVLPQPGAFTITPTPSSFTLPRGNSATVNIAIGRTDFSGPIALAFDNPPPGITGAIVPATTTGNTATLTLNVGDAVAGGIYTLRIRGTAPGFVDRVAFLTVTVTIPVGASVEYLFCDPAKAPVFVAYQDGSGAWRPLTPTSQGTVTRFAFTLIQDRGGVLAVSRTTTSVAPLVDYYGTEVVYASANELAQLGFENCRLTQVTKTVNVNVNGVSAGENGIVSLGSATRVFVGGVTTNPMAISGVADGLLDLIASRQVSAGNPPNRLVVMRGQLVPDGGTVPSAIDFTAPSSLAPAIATATLSNGGTDLFDLTVTLTTDYSHGKLWFDPAPSLGSTRTWAGLAPADMQPNDLHGLIAAATPAPAVAGDFRIAARYVGPIANQTLTFGPALAVPAVQQVTAGTYPRYRFTGTVQSDYDKGVAIEMLPRSAPGNTYRVTASSAWLAGAGSALAYNLTMPDVAGLAGFPLTSRLSGGPNDSSVRGFGFNGQGIFELRPASGREFKAASRGFTVQVP